MSKDERARSRKHPCQSVPFGSVEGLLCAAYCSMGWRLSVNQICKSPACRVFGSHWTRDLLGWFQPQMSRKCPLPPHTAHWPPGWSSFLQSTRPKEICLKHKPAVSQPCSEPLCGAPVVIAALFTIPSRWQQPHVRKWMVQARPTQTTGWDSAWKRHLQHRG